ncbi:hypothetical protein [Azospirillum thermophilum]|nr:hypothetical protein [Azospirillum thermophilum]
MNGDFAGSTPAPTPLDQPLLAPPASGRFLAGAAPARPAGQGGDPLAWFHRLMPVLEALEPGEAAFLQAGLPRCDSTFGLALAVFLAATARGAQDWLGGETSASLDELDGGALLEEVEEALEPRSRRSADGRLWRTLRIPVAAGDGAHSLLWGVAVEDGEAGDGVHTAVSFLLQMRLPALGAVQLLAAGDLRRLDVTLQTAEGMPASVLADLHADYAAAMADAGLTGQLTIGSVVGSWLDLDGTLSADTTL